MNIRRLRTCSGVFFCCDMIQYQWKCNKKGRLNNNMDSILIKDTTREEREKIVADSMGNINGSCDGCAAGLAEMYQDYIDGKKEIRDINMEFSARTSIVNDCGYDYEDIHDPCLRFQK